MPAPATPRRVLLLGAVWLAFVWAVALVAARSTPWLTARTGWSEELSRRLPALARWDSGWYVSIAEGGYEAPPVRVGQETNHAFFPLYPALMRGASCATGLDVARAGALVSAAALLGALLLLAAWTRRRFGEERVWPALLAFLAFPTSFFFAAVYSESLLLFLALGAVLALEEDRDGLAAAAGLLTGLTRISGLVLAPALFLVSWRRSRERGRPVPQALLRAGLVGASPLAGFGLFCLYFHELFGDALLFVKAQHNWSREAKTVFDGPRLILQEIVRDLATGHVFVKSPIRTMEGVFLLLFLFLAWRLAARRLWPEALYVFMTVAIVFTSGTLESGGRYVLPAFPAFAVLGGLAARPELFRVFVALSLLVQAGYVWLYVHWLWVG
ncbi:MAG: mannosyltransferase family protein [Acidobacteriota bacterium]